MSVTMSDRLYTNEATLIKSIKQNGHKTWRNLFAAACLIMEVLPGSSRSACSIYWAASVRLRS